MRLRFNIGKGQKEIDRMMHHFILDFKLTQHDLHKERCAKNAIVSNGWCMGGCFERAAEEVLVRRKAFGNAELERRTERRHEQLLMELMSEGSE